MKRINVRFVEEGGKLLMMIDPSQIPSIAHAEEILRDLIAQWVREKRNRGMVTYEPLPNEQD